MNSAEVTFFMIVTPRDVVIADYAIRSYAKIHGLEFRLLVYSNYLLPEQKEYYFPRWESLPFVEVARNPHHDDDISAIGTRVNAERLEGPFEYCDPIWDREPDNRFSLLYNEPESPLSQCIRSETRDLLARVIADLPEKEQQVLALYYREGLTMKQVGALMGIGESRVSQVHAAAVVALRARLAYEPRDRTNLHHDREM